MFTESKTRAAVGIGVTAFALVLGGCTDRGSEPPVTFLEQPALTSNALTSNALTSNALTSNALTSNALTSNALTSNALTSNALTSNALTSNGDARQFLKYAYSCAMPAGASEALSIADENGNLLTLTLEGSLGLWPEWGSGKCNLTCQERISACLLARTNMFGVTVALSLRGEPLAADASERTAFPFREGTFYGNVFKTKNEPGQGDVPDARTYACAGPNSNRGMVTARFCSGLTTSEQCTISVGGPCTCPDGTLDCASYRACESVNTTDGWNDDCWTPLDDSSDGRKYDQALTVFLAEPLETCGNLVCDSQESVISCPFDCFGHTWALLPGLLSRDNTVELAALPDGNVVIAGTFLDRLDFGPAGVLSADPSHQNTPGYDTPGFIAKIDPISGAPLWAYQVGTEVSGVATDAAGNIVVAGASGTDKSDVKAWVMKLPPSGNPSQALWSVELPGSVSPIGVGFDGSGAVVLASTFYEKLSFGSENQPRIKSTKNVWSSFVGKLAANTGSPDWLSVAAPSVPGPHDRWTALAVGKGAGEIFLTGGAGSFCGAGSCLRRYDAAGALVWSVPLSVGGAAGAPRDAAVAGDGSVYVTGRKASTPRDAFVARYSGAGAVLWTSALAGSGFDATDALAEGTEIDVTGSLVSMAGSFPKSPDAAGESFYEGGQSDVDDIYAAGFEAASGAPTWIKHAGGAFQDFVEGLAVLPSGRIVIAGRFVGTMLFEGNMLSVPGSTETGADPDSWGLFIGSLVGEPDTTPPELDLPGDKLVEATSSAGASVSYSASAEDALDGAVPVSCAPASGTTFPLGATVVSCSATDSAGNTANGSFTVTVADTTPPVVSVPGPIVLEAASPAGATAVFNASASDTVSGAVAVDCTPPSGGVFPLGATTVTCSASDGSGNSGSASFTVSVVDTTPPSMTVPSDMALEATSAAGAVAMFVASATDTVDPSVVAVCTPSSGSTFPLGTTNVHCSATDASGNSASGSFDVTVSDTTAPALTLPSDIGVEAVGPAGTAVDFAASALDTVDGSVAVFCSPASGTTFPLGQTEVSCSAADAAGNTASGGFFVSVVDTTLPALDPPGDITAEATGPAGASVTFPASATDTVGGALSVVCTPPSGSTFALGTTAVSCSATDPSGNTASGNFSVSVVDTTPPVLSVPSGPLSPPPGTNVVTYVATANDLVDGTVPVACTPPSGSAFAFGTTTVSCTATDAAGNSASASFEVRLAYSWSGFLSPINSNSTTVVKRGSSLPVKFELTGTSAGITNLYATLWVAPVTGGVVGSEFPATGDGPTNQFHYLTGSSHYDYSMATGGLAKGTFRIRAELYDGVSTRTALIQIK